MRSKTGTFRIGSSTRCRRLATAAGLALSIGSRVLAQTDANWTNSVSGNWIDPTKWSIGQYPNDNTPPGSTYRAIFAAAGPAYTVTLNSDIAVSGLVLNSAGLTLAHTAGTLTLNGAADFTSGTFQLNGGTIAGGTLNLNGGGFSIRNNAANRFRGVTINGTMNMTSVGAQLRVADGLSFGSGSSLVMNAGFAAKLVFENSQTISGGTVSLHSGMAYVDAGVTLTIAPSATIRGSATTLGNKSVAGAANAIINQGLIFADTSGQTMTISADSLTNSGTIGAANGGTLIVDHLTGDMGTLSLTGASTLRLNGNYTNSGTINIPQGASLYLAGAWSNTGTINAAAGSILDLDGAFTTSTLGTINRSGATFQLSGTLDNTGQVFDLGQSGPVILSSGVIHGGTVNLATANLTFNNNGGTFDGVTLNGDLNVTSQTHVSLMGGTVCNGNINISGSQSGLTFVDTQTFSNGTITFSGPNGGIGVGQGATLTLSPTAVVRGGGGGIGSNATGTVGTLINQGLISSDAPVGISINVPTFINQGTIEALNGSTLFATVLDASCSLGNSRAIGTGSRLYLLGNGFTNNGTMTLSGGGLATLSGQWINSGVINVGSGSTLTLALNSPTPSVLGTINNSGTVAISGIVENTGSTFPLNGNWATSNFTLRNGTISAAPGATLTPWGSTILTAITLDGALTCDVANSANITIQGSLTLTPGSLLTLAGPGLSLVRDGPVTLDGGTIAFGGPVGADRAISGAFTLGPNLVIRGGRGTIGGGAVENYARISADVPGQMITVFNGFTNHGGTVEAINGGTLKLMSYSGTGIVRADGPGSTLILNGVNAAPASATNGASLTLSGSPWSNTSTLTLNNSTLVLTGTGTIAGLGTVNNTSGLIRLSGTLNNNSNTFFPGPATGNWIVDGGTIDGGTITLPQNYLSFSNNPNNTIHNANTSIAAYITGGTVTGDLFRPSGPLTISGGATVSLRNAGTMANVVVNNSSLTLAGGNSTVGSLALNDSTLNITQAGISMSIVGRTTRTGNTTVTCSGTMNNTGLTTTFDSSTGVWNMNSLRVDGGTINTDGPYLAFGNSTANLFVSTTFGTPFAMTGGYLTCTTSTFTAPVSVSGGATLALSSAGVLTTPFSVDGANLKFTGGSAVIAGGITASNGSTLTLGGQWSNSSVITVNNSTLNLGGDFSAASMGTIVRNNATVNLVGNYNNTGATLLLSPSTGAWNLGGNATITGGSVNTTGGVQLSTLPGSTFNRLSGVNFQGSVYVAPSSTLTLDGNWSNTGSIAVDGGMLQLAGAFTGASVGSISRQGASRVSVTGTINNTGSSITLDSTTGSWEMNHAFINGGTVNLTQGSTLLFNAPEEITQYRWASLSGVTLNGDVELPNIAGFTNVHPTLFLTNGLTLNGNLNINGTTTFLTALGTQTITGGTISLVGAASQMGIDTTDSSITPTLTLSSTTLVRGGQSSLRSASSHATGLINNGRISADVPGAMLAVSCESTVSNGTLEAVNGGILFLGAGATGSLTSNGLLRAAGGGVINLGSGFNSLTRFGPGSTLDTAGGTINITGAIDNTGNTLALNTTTGTWNFSDGLIRGGNVVIGAGGGLRVLSGHAGILDNVSLTGTVNPANGLRIWNDFTLNGGLTLTTDHSTISFAGGTPQTMHGGTLALLPVDGTFPGSVSVLLTPSAPLTLSPTTIVRGGGAFSSNPTASIGLNFSGSGTTTLINQGLISADINQRELSIVADNFTNQGIVEAKDGGQIKIPDRVHNTWSNQGGTFRLLNGGTAYLGGTFTSAGVGQYDGAGGHTYVTGVMDNSSSTWNVTPALGPWTLTNWGQVKGGTINIVPGGDLSVTYLGRLDGVTLNGDLNVLSGGLIVRNGITLNGTIHLSGPGSQLSFESVGSVSLTSGTIAFDNLAGEPAQLAAGLTGSQSVEFTIGAGAVVHGGTGNIFTSASGGSTIINQGLISADRPGEAITIYLSRFQNDGIIQAINGGQIVFIPPGPPLSGGDGSLFNSGLLSVALGTQMSISGDLVQGASGALSLWVGPEGAASSIWADEIDADGTLRVSLEPGFVPSQGNAFQILSTGRLVGQFSTLDLPTLPQGLLWNTGSLYDGGVIRVVPAPGAMALLLGGGLLCFRRRRSRTEGV